MLNDLLQGTNVPVTRHLISNENDILLCGRTDEILFNEKVEGIERIHLCPTGGKYGYMVPIGVWHTVEIFEPSVFFEAKNGKFTQRDSPFV